MTFPQNTPYSELQGSIWSGKSAAPLTCFFPLPLAYFPPATQIPLLFLKHVRHFPISGTSLLAISSAWNPHPQIFECLASSPPLNLCSVSPSCNTYLTALWDTAAIPPFCSPHPSIPYSPCLPYCSPWHITLSDTHFPYWSASSH